MKTLKANSSQFEGIIVSSDSASRVLARRPVHLPTSHDMEMKMEHFLSSIRAVIDHHSKPVLKSLLCSHLPSNHHQVTKNLWKVYNI